MISHTSSCLFWPGITNVISRTRELCKSCNSIAPSQPRCPPIFSNVPGTPFKAIVANFCDMGGYRNLVIADRLSEWKEVTGLSNSKGVKGLLASLRSFFVTFKVLEEISSNNGPEFASYETAEFLRKWGITHHTSSAYFLQSNGRAEVAIKKNQENAARQHWSEWNIEQ
uniref:Putative LOC101858828 [Aplysia californica] n=1 Tax=Lepeophtheirus salmonis TaxID=72036 RepID=A0A0K2TVJ7_LEPSM